ncbi:general secretion pathway protein GspN [Luteimonas sp. Y-2-2-4F]|nr:general secretion pathway protein GspN [Luteimonas sp. Y-2-2-4F]MCD9030525.1 general secretion pathway protein GspN [Luteimonas sp. Y-2-2-4F]
MRLEGVGATTGLLAATALWAVLVWGLALFGLAGRVAPLPDDPSLAQALPEAPEPAAERLGPPTQYAEIGERPLFAEDRRHRPFLIDGSGEEIAAPSFDLVLTSVLITPSLEMAIVQPRDGGESLRVRVGEAPRGFGGWTLRSVAPRSAAFDGPEGERTLELRVYDGVGGQPPTPIAQAPRPGGPPGRLPAPPPPPPQAPPSPQAVAQAQAQDAARGAPAQAPQPGQAPPPEAAAADGAQRADPTPESQAEAIRRRIEARRARLRAEQAAQQQNP